MLRTAIYSGQYAPGTQLPTESELMAQHHVSRNTVRLAHGKLTNEGLIEAVPRRTFSCGPNGHGDSTPRTKVVEAQGGIKCELLNMYLDGNTAIVEWEAQFDDLAQRVRKRMREVVILVLEGPADREPSGVLVVRANR